MTSILIKKLLRDIWAPLLVIAIILAAFQCLWAHITRRISSEVIPEVTEYILKYKTAVPGRMIPVEFMSKAPEEIAKDLQRLLFKGPGKIIQSLIGGESIELTNGMDLLSVGFVHPLIQTILCIWALGRAAGALTGEIDRGTMELLLAQPIRRWKIIQAHFLVDVLTVPVLCLSMWSGVWLGSWMVGLLDYPDPQLRVDPWRFAAALPSVALLVFSITGYTLAFSAFGRFRSKVLGWTILTTLLQFLINVVGQLWEPASSLRSWTVFYYYQPQPIILNPDFVQSSAFWWNNGVLCLVGLIGYGIALWRFSHRDLPAPL